MNWRERKGQPRLRGLVSASGRSTASDVSGDISPRSGPASLPGCRLFDGELGREFTAPVVSLAYRLEAALSACFWVTDGLARHRSASDSWLLELAAWLSKNVQAMHEKTDHAGFSGLLISDDWLA